VTLTAPDFLPLPDGNRLAFHRAPGRGPEVLFVHGFRSDMTGEKAVALERHCRERGLACTRFDCRGHGASSGRFEDLAIGDWARDVLAVLDRVVDGPCVLVGSSMGGWLALLAALARPERVVGLVGIAAAPDFTADLIRPRLPPEAVARLEAEGLILAPSAYGDPYPITRRLLEDGERHLLLHGPIPLHVPVHLLHGQEDADVPWQTALRLAAQLESPAVTVELVKDGGHRLSRPEDLRRITAAVDRVVEQAGRDRVAKPLR
jgi:pimeloyl-ACP methyl ester carboxylesterase